MRHSVEHPAGGRDVAEVGVEDDELGAEVEVRRRGGGLEDDPAVHGLAFPEGVGADEALEQGGVKRGGGSRAIGKGHCGASYLTPTGLPHPADVEVVREAGRRDGSWRRLPQSR